MKCCVAPCFRLTDKTPGRSGLQPGVHHAGHLHRFEHIRNWVHEEPPSWTIRQVLRTKEQSTSSSSDIYSSTVNNDVAQEVHMKLLQIDSSARAGSVTRRLTAQFAAEWRKSHPAGELIRRDLSTTTLPLITDDWNATRVEPSKL